MKQYESILTKQTIEAAQLTADNAPEIATWCGGFVVEEIDPMDGERYPALNIRTPHGNKRLSQGHYVMHFDNLFYVIQAGLFESMYKEIEVAGDDVDAGPSGPRPRGPRRI